ncbi:hypothetical protein ACHAXM_004672 [Skeletonema potamos]|jgi:hypothetical protein
MSSRALRRLRVQEASLAEDQEGDESSSDEEQSDGGGGGGGGFMAMLEEESSSEEDSSDSDEDDKSDAALPAAAVAATVASNKSKKEQITPSKKQRQPREEEEDDEDEDLDAILSDMKLQNQLTGDETENNNDSSFRSSTIRSILLSRAHGYDTQDLDLDYAMRDLLGGAAVAGGNPLFIDDDDIIQQQLQQRGRNNRNRGGGRNNRRTVAKKYLFGKVKPEWGKPPSFVGGGLGVKELTQEQMSMPWPYNVIGNDAPNAKWFTFQMSDTYLQINRKYEELLSNPQAGMQDPNLLAMFVADNPFFAETILQMAMVLYYVNDRRRGSDLLRRCMYLYETALPSSLLPSNNANDSEVNHEIFFDVDQKPNAGFFAALFRIMQTSGMSGCHPNALSVGRYLLSIDPLRDPMGVLLILDYYALASRRTTALSDEDEDGVEVGASFIVDLVESDKITIHYKDPLTSRHHQCPLIQMPNWSFSYAMALYRLSREEQADEALMNALEQYPMVLPKLLEMNKVNVRARSFQMDWPTVLPAFNHDLNAANINESNTQIEARVARAAGEHLVRIFVERHHKLWKENDVIQWIYSCSEKLVKGAHPPIEDEEDAGEEGRSTEVPIKQLTSTFSPALARYAQCDPSDYEDQFRTFPPEAIALNPNLVAPALVHDHRRGRFLRVGQARGGGMVEREMMEDMPADLMEQLRGMLGMAGHDEVDLLDPDSPILQLYLQSLLPWARVDGVRPPR